ncbi:hypothetical protein RHGRI_026462 [Rhododendron griersonianum]|uniref:Uncharacterized protein n=1 Tax=Rhododendron griersonianum TaxID=479676 RepID=A0AAV6IXY3_9ERIC|nr:hypothetical protein RHGRI_026462 [Rhododendron griersonianum]
MVVPEPGHFLAPGARITSRIGNTPVFIDVAEIATALDYQRPTRPVNFPRPDETFDQNEIAGYLYEHRKNARIPHWPGRFTTTYRFINQGDLDSSFIQRSMAQLRGIEGSLLSPPPASASTKTWLEKIFGCLTGLARSQRKLKREQRQLARNQADLLERQRHMEAQISGQNPWPFQPRRWPALEVNDDFADEPEEEEHSDAGDGN